MVTKTTDDLFWGQAIMCVDATGTVPVTTLGYTAEGTPVTISGTKDEQQERVNEFSYPVEYHQNLKELKIALTLAQVNPTTLSYALGVNADTLEINLGGGIAALPKFTARVVGTLKNDEPIHIICLNAQVTSDFAFETNRAGQAVLPIEFGALDSTSYAGSILCGRTATEVAISTGGLARVQAATINGICHHTMTSETGTEDDLDDITSGSGAVLTEQELIRIQPASTHAITVKHASGVIELQTAADFIMNNVNDWLDLWYDLSETTWFEIARYDAPN